VNPEPEAIRSRQFTVGPLVGRWPFLCGSHRPGFGWFRVFGFGVTWKDATRHELLFSERYGYTRRLHVGRWRIGGLKR
jgi:hypothetical protein